MSQKEKTVQRTCTTLAPRTNREDATYKPRDNPKAIPEKGGDRPHHNGWGENFDQEERRAPRLGVVVSTKEKGGNKKEGRFGISTTGGPKFGAMTGSSGVCKKKQVEPGYLLRGGQKNGKRTLRAERETISNHPHGGNILRRNQTAKGGGVRSEWRKAIKSTTMRPRPHTK